MRSRVRVTRRFRMNRERERLQGRRFTRVVEVLLDAHGWAHSSSPFTADETNSRFVEASWVFARDAFVCPGHGGCFG
jgi:hypothetical protein